MLVRHREWIAALGVLVVTALAVILDVTDGAVRNFWYHHSFTSSVVSGLLVLLLTVLVVDRVNRMRQVKGQSLVVSVQAAVIVAQIRRAAEAVRRTGTGGGDEVREEAFEELRNAIQMLFASSPVLIDAKRSRAFLEVAQGTVGRLFQTARRIADDDRTEVDSEIDDALARLQNAAAPLVATLNRDQRAAISSDQGAETAP
jgi:chromosome condensin MukBEF complex kleisin-like MukF subunit